MSVWDSLRHDLTTLVSTKGCGPILIRLSWHDAGTFDKSSGTGGAHACMRFADASSEAHHGGNAGLQVARDLLQDIVDRYTAKGISVADIWAYAAVVAVKVMGGPDVPFRYGRKDAQSAQDSVEEGRLPDAAQGADHIRAVLGRIGMNDREMVALCGAHTVGKCHLDRSGFDGPWTSQPLVFDNEYFKLLLDPTQWKQQVNAKGNTQFADVKGQGLMMLPSDMALQSDPEFFKVVQEYAQDQAAFFKDFASAFQKLQEAGASNLVEVSK
jgi:cytochrome c peroxidase